MFLKSVFLLALASPVFSFYDRAWSNRDGFHVEPSNEPFSSVLPATDFYFQYDGNFVVYLRARMDPADAAWNSQTGGVDCTKISCELIFQTDGNLVIYQNNVAVWNTGTFPLGAKLSISHTLPYVRVTDTSGNDLWNATRECVGTECFL